MTVRPKSKSETPAVQSGAGFGAPEALVSGILIGSFGFGLVLLLLKGADVEWTWAYWGDSDGNFDRSAIFRNFGLLAVALVGFPLAIWRSWTAHRQVRTANKQAELSEKGLIIDRYQKAAQMLESDELSMRLSGLYALRELVKSDPDDTYIMVMDLLYDFVRERSKQRQPDWSSLNSVPRQIVYTPLPIDAQRALNISNLLRLTTQESDRLEQNWTPDLRDANLSGTNLAFAKLNGVDLSNAVLTHAVMPMADLSGANLCQADMSFANLSRADLSNAEIIQSKLRCTHLLGANLSNAILSSANLSQANLTDTDLTETGIYFSDLSRAYVFRSNLTGAYFGDSDLSKCVFHQNWCTTDQMPEGLAPDYRDKIASRGSEEPWNGFVDRNLRERPELGWTVSDKKNTG